MKLLNPDMGTIVKGGAFCGIGGFDIAADWMGWHTKFNCEPDKFCTKILNHYWPHAKNHHDITTADFSIYRGKIDVFTGGFPCQPFSQAGKRGGTDDYRYLWPEMYKAIAALRPTWVIGENVTGILSMADEYNVWKEVFFRVDSRNIARLQEVDKYEAIYTQQRKMLLHSIVQDLEKIGYSVQVFTIPAAAAGAPHKRDRVWIVAHTGNNGYGNGGHGKAGQTEGQNKGQEDQRQRVFNEFGGNGAKETIADTRCNCPGGTDQSERTSDNPARCSGPKDEGIKNILGNATHTQSGGHGRLRNPEPTPGSQESNEPLGKQFGIPDEKGNIAHPNGKRSKEQQSTTQPDQQERQYSQTHIASRPGHWKDFPTQSPVCGRNDGFSSQLDGITLSAWRNQSIKGYGNAIVPQVALEIYKAIQQEYNKYN